MPSTAWTNARCVIGKYNCSLVAIAAQLARNSPAVEAMTSVLMVTVYVPLYLLRRRYRGGVAAESAR